MKKVVSLLVALVMVFSLTNVYAEDSIVQSEAITKGRVEKGQFTVEFEHEAAEEDINFGTDKIRYVSYHNGIYTFEALEDLDNVVVRFTVRQSSGTEKEDLEEGGSSIGDTSNLPPASEQKWKDFGVGKQGWKQKDENKIWQGKVLYSIKLDFTEDKYQGIDSIIVHDTGSLNNIVVGEIRARYYTNIGGYTSKPIEEETIIFDRDGKHEWDIELPVIPNRKVDIVYYTQVEDMKEPTNDYEVYTLREWEELDVVGEVGGDNKPTPDPQPGNPPRPEQPKEPELAQPLDPGIPIVPEVPREPEEDVPPKELPREPEEDVPPKELPREPEEDVPPKELPEPELPDSEDEEIEKPTIEEKTTNGRQVEEDRQEDKQDTTVKETLPATGEDTKIYVLAGLLLAGVGLMIFINKEER